MAALGMPRRGKVNLGECRQRAVHVGRGEIVWQDRCHAANGSKEPFRDLGFRASPFKPCQPLQANEVAIVLCGGEELPKISRDRPFADDIPKRACQWRLRGNKLP
jgi:hypothetical protein